MKPFVKNIVSDYLRPLSYLWILSALSIISFPFVWLWCSYYYAWRISLTGIIAIIIISLLYNGLKKMGTDIIEREMSREIPTDKPKVSKWQQRMDKMAKERGLS